MKTNFSMHVQWQVVELLGSILERPIIQAEYTICLPHLLQLLKQEIETAKVCKRSCSCCMSNKFHKQLKYNDNIAFPWNGLKNVYS